jgi:transposase
MLVDINNLKVYQAGVSAVIAALCDVLKIPEIIDGTVSWDQSQCRLSPGTRVKALIINILTHRRALSNVSHFFRHYDMEVLFGSDKQVRAEELNDDALGRALDKLAASDLKTIFSSIALNAAAMHNVPIEGLHVDTTSVSVQGEYEGEGGLDITFGFSKDHRPDLKQFMIGLTVTRDGLPILGRSLDGNTSDKTWYPKVIKELVDKIKPEKLDKVIFVADSALVTNDNLALLAQENLKFISRQPENYSMVDRVKEEAMAGNWTDIGVLSNKKDAAKYKSQSFIREIDGRPYRLIAVHSTALDKRKEKSLMKKWEKQKKELEKENNDLVNRPFACEADALKAIELFVKRHRKKPFTFRGSITSETISKYPNRGRPRIGVLPESTINYHANVTIEEDPEAMVYEKDKASIFVLLTNLLDTETYPDTLVLKEYKEQNAVEKQFRFLKQPFILGFIYLKNKNRVEAMSFVFQLALLVAAYLEYRVRNKLKHEKSPLIIPPKRKSYSPTARALMEMFDPLMVVKQGLERELIHYEGPEETLRALDLAGFGKKVYLTPSWPGS